MDGEKKGLKWRCVGRAQNGWLCVYVCMYGKFWISNGKGKKFVILVWVSIGLEKGW